MSSSVSSSSSGSSSGFSAGFFLFLPPPRSASEFTSIGPAVTPPPSLSLTSSVSLRTAGSMGGGVSGVFGWSFTLSGFDILKGVIGECRWRVVFVLACHTQTLKIWV